VIANVAGLRAGCSSLVPACCSRCVLSCDHRTYAREVLRFVAPQPWRAGQFLLVISWAGHFLKSRSGCGATRWWNACKRRAMHASSGSSLQSFEGRDACVAADPRTRTDFRSKRDEDEFSCRASSELRRSEDAGSASFDAGWIEIRQSEVWSLDTATARDNEVAHRHAVAGRAQSVPTRQVGLAEEMGRTRRAVERRQGEGAGERRGASPIRRKSRLDDSSLQLCSTCSPFVWEVGRPGAIGGPGPRSSNESGRPIRPSLGP
jgi:hypothetical protein